MATTVTLAAVASRPAGTYVSNTFPTTNLTGREVDVAFTGFTVADYTDPTWDVVGEVDGNDTPGALNTDPGWYCIEGPYNWRGNALSQRTSEPSIGFILGDQVNAVQIRAQTTLTTQRTWGATATVN